VLRLIGVRGAQVDAFTFCRTDRAKCPLEFSTAISASNASPLGSLLRMRELFLLALQLLHEQTGGGRRRIVGIEALKIAEQFAGCA